MPLCCDCVTNCEGSLAAALRRGEANQLADIGAWQIDLAVQEVRGGLELDGPLVGLCVRSGAKRDQMRAWVGSSK